MAGNWNFPVFGPPGGPGARYRLCARARKKCCIPDVLGGHLEKAEYQQVSVVFNRWSHHSHQLLLQIEQYQAGQRNREGVIISLQKLINLNKYFVALFAAAMTRLVYRDKPAFSDISEQIEIGQCTTA